MVKFKLPGTIVGASSEAQDTLFFVTNPYDAIQGHHAQGRFYELEELALIEKYMTADTVYLDIGANIGNHILYLSRKIGLRKVIAVEPNPAAIAVLKVNLLLNHLLSSVDISLLGYGLSDQDGTADVFAPMHNLGAARLYGREGGSLKITTGDELLKDRNVDFIKIDVEGMEIQCLRGMPRLIERCRPTMFVEVDNTNVADFNSWCQQNCYEIKETYRRYAVNENYLIRPLDVG